MVGERRDGETVASPQERFMDFVESHSADVDVTAPKGTIRTGNFAILAPEQLVHVDSVRFVKFYTSESDLGVFDPNSVGYAIELRHQEEAKYGFFLIDNDFLEFHGDNADDQPLSSPDEQISRFLDNLMAREANGTLTPVVVAKE